MSSQKKNSTAELRRKNRNNIYCYLYHAEQPKTKQDVALALSLSLPTVTQNLKELLESGLIEYAGLVNSNGGRRARTMQIVPHACIAVGIALSPKHIRLAAIDLRGKEIAYQCFACAFSTHESYQRQMAEVLEQFLNNFGLERTRLLGIGITLPGIINEQTGMIEVAPILGIRQMRLSHLTEFLPYPVFVMNDASAGGYAECWNQNKPDAMAYLFLGKGVGGALMINGQPYTGDNQRSAEFGHICIMPVGRRCCCGKRGCLEAYCSISRISDDLGISIETFFDLLDKGNAEYGTLWNTYLEHLANGIHIIRMVMDCDIVIGGSITPYLSPYMDDLRTKLHHRDGFGSDGSYLHLGACGTKANCIGVALHFVAQFMENV